MAAPLKTGAFAPIWFTPWQTVHACYKQLFTPLYSVPPHTIIIFLSAAQPCHTVSLLSPLHTIWVNVWEKPSTPAAGKVYWAMLKWVSEWMNEQGSPLFGGGRGEEGINYDKIICEEKRPSSSSFSSFHFLLALTLATPSPIALLALLSL